MILITGANGQVGKELQTMEVEFSSLETIPADRKQLDISQQEAIEDFFNKNKNIKYCINCAAYTAVDKAETETELAQKVNADGVKLLAENCKKRGIHFIHISSDYVYHNEIGIPIKEDAETSPKGVYAKTKLKGDEYALDLGGMVIRTSWVYSYFGNNFVKTMVRLGKEKEQLTIVADQIGSPTYARDIAKMILTIIDKVESKSLPSNILQGIYNYSNEGVTTWYDFAKAIFEYKNLSCKALPIESKDYPTPAKRPHFSVLNKTKIKEVFNIEIPHWQDSLNECLDLIN